QASSERLSASDLARSAWDWMSWGTVGYCAREIAEKAQTTSAAVNRIFIVSSLLLHADALGGKVVVDFPFVLSKDRGLFFGADSVDGVLAGRLEKLQDLCLLLVVQLAAELLE